MHSNISMSNQYSNHHHALVGQQTNHYNQLDLNNPKKTRAKTPMPKNTRFSNNNRNQSLSQINECVEDEEEIILKNFSKNITLRKKITNQEKSRKRLSDSILNHFSQFSLLNNLHLYFQQQTNIDNKKDEIDNLSKHRHSLNFQQIPTMKIELQKLFIIRHGERVDSTFGTNWIDQVFDKTTGVYHRINLNLPKNMVRRKDVKDFVFDPPLTELGLYQCKMIGEELALNGIQIDYIYSSPALRCIQTADKILEGLQMRDKVPIRIEPCLFEFLKWYPIIPVKWPFLNNDELIDNGFNIDRSYKPFYPIESLRKDEDELMFYRRSHCITKSILNKHRTNLLFVGHASTIEVCTRQITGGQPRINELKFLVSQVPFLSMHSIEKQTDGTWKATKPPISPNKHTAVEPFDWRFFK